MTALAAAGTRTSKHTGDVKRFLMAASTQIWKDGLVCVNSAGLAVPAAATAGFKGAVGVATESVLSAASGSYYVEVQEGTFRFAGTTLEQDDAGSAVYAADDNTIDETQGTNYPLAGILVEYESASVGWVWVSWKTNAAFAKGSKVYGHWTFSIPLATIIDGDLITGFTPGFAGVIEKTWCVATTVASTAAKLSTLNLEIGTTDVTGGELSLTTAALDTLGEVLNGAAITADNAFTATDTISVEGSSTTAFGEGVIELVVQYSIDIHA